MYLIVAEHYNNNDGYNFRPIGYATTKTKADEIVDILNLKVKKRKEIKEVFRKDNIKTNIYKVIKLKECNVDITKEYIINKYDLILKKKHEEFEEHKKDLERFTKKFKDREINRLKNIIYRFIYKNEDLETINPTRLKTKKKQMKEYLYLTDDSELLKWINEKGINIHTN